MRIFMSKICEFIKKYDILILIILGILLYFPVFSFGFIGLDDTSFLVLKNQYLNGKVALNFFDFFKPKFVVEAVYIPFTFIVYWVVIKFFGQSAFALHFVNILFYLLSSVALLVLLKKIIQNDLIAFLATVLYLIHPAHIEYVIWIATLGYNIASFFAFLSMIFFISAFDENKKFNFVYSSIFYLLSVLSQPATVVVVIFPIVWVYFFRKEKFVNSIKYFIPNCLVSVVYIYLSYMTMETVRFNKLSYSFLEKLQIFGRYLINSFFPIFQMPIYSLPSIWYLIPLCLLIIIFILIKKYNLIKNYSCLYFWCTWYIISILPYSSIVYTIETPITDRYLMLPSVSSCVALSYLCVFIFNKLQNSKLLRFFIPSVFFVFYFISSILYIPVWNNSKSFWPYAYSMNPSGTASGFASCFLIREGKFQEAMVIADEIIKKKPKVYDGYEIKIQSLLGLFEYKKALDICFDFKKIKPNYYKTDVYMFTSYFNMGEYDKAEESLKNAEELYKKYNYLNEDYTKTFLDKKIMLAYCKVEEQKFFEALKICNDKDIDNLLQYFSSKSLKYEQKEKSCIEFLRNYPTNKYSAYVLMLLNTLYMEHKYKDKAFEEMTNISKDMIKCAELLQYDKLEEAEKIYLSIIERDKYIYNAYSNLGLIYIKMSNHDKANAILQKALEINPNDEKVINMIKFVQ